MLKFYKIIFIALLTFHSVKAAQSDEIIKDLNSDDFGKKTMTVEQMVTSDDSKYFSVLNALLESNLYLFGEASSQKMVSAIIIETANKKEYRLMEVYPQFKELKEAGSPVVLSSLQDLKEIKANRVIRNLIQPVADKIQLYHWDDKKRLIAIKNLAATGDQSYIPVFKKLSSQETNTSIINGLQTSIYQILLSSNVKEDKLLAINGLAESSDADAQELLRGFVSTEKDTELKEKAHAVIEAMESSNKRKEVFQNIFSGLSLGSILILMALGLAIIYGLMGIINMAHGEFMMIGAYTTFAIQSLFVMYLPSQFFDLYFWVALPLSFIVSGAFGMLTEFLIIRFLYNRPLESLLATWGVSLIFIQLARTIFGDLTSVKMPSFATGGMEILPQLVLPYSRIFIIAVTIIVVLVVRYVLTKTTFGLKIRAVTQNRNMSACLGVPTARVNRYAFFLGTGIAGVAGWALTLISNVVPNMGQTYIVDSFLVVVTGGVGKLAGTVLSGLGMGFTTKFLEPIFQAVYGKVLILILVILFLQIKPTGLFPAKGRSEE